MITIAVRPPTATPRSGGFLENRIEPLWRKENHSPRIQVSAKKPRREHAVRQVTQIE
jgi:hypothetical protein